MVLIMSLFNVVNPLTALQGQVPVEPMTICAQLSLPKVVVWAKICKLKVWRTLIFKVVHRNIMPSKRCFLRS